MKRLYPVHLVFLTVVLLLLAACGPFGRKEPTAEPTIAVPTKTAAPDIPMVTVTPAKPASATPTMISFITPEPKATTTPYPTDAPTSVPPTDTPPPTPTPVPPTATSAPTQPSQPTHTQVPPTATSTPTHTPLPPVVITDWRAEFFDNIFLQGPAVAVRNDLTVDLNLSGGEAPASGVPGQNWSARWTRNWTFEEGNYRFHVVVDDGARLWVGGNLFIDTWTDGPARTFTGDLYLKGQVSIQLDYYNRLGDARVLLNWEPVRHFDGWKGSYYANPILSGLPLFQRDDLTINFNWGSSSPRGDLPADGFSVRWSRAVEFAESGQYRFAVESDDGVRLWVGDTLVIDDWQDGRSSRETLHRLSAGTHHLQVEYYEHWGDALIQLSWERVPPTPTPTDTPLPPTATPTVPPRPTLPPTATPTVPPRPTSPPTATPAPFGPQIAPDPAAGPIGEPFEVIGSQWPANSLVELFLVRPVPEPGDGELVETANSDAEGRFTATLTIPANHGWEGLSAATIKARANDVAEDAQATYELLPRLWDIPFSVIPTGEDRYEILEPTYLVLDSEEDWNEWFGPRPPQADPPINWETEIVLGAFLGQGDGVRKVDVDEVVQREAMVSVWLSVVVPEGGLGDQDRVNAPRVMIRISRDDLREPGGDKPTVWLFAFLDATGRLLAQGPAGGALPRTPPREPGQFEALPGQREKELSDADEVEMQAAPEEQAVVAAEAEAPVGESAPEAERAVALAPESEAPAAEPAEAGSEPEASTAQADETVQADGRVNTWLWVGGGFALLLGGALVVWFGLGAVRRRRNI